MRIGVPQENKVQEHRVGLTPASVRELRSHGHEVLVQCGAGAAVGLDDQQYRRAGASLVSNAEELFAQAEMIVKVKEPQPAECRMLRPGQASTSATAPRQPSRAAWDAPGQTLRDGSCAERPLQAAPLSGTSGTTLRS